MKKRFGIGNHIPEIRDRRRANVYYADKEANPLYPVPVLMSAAELETFYYMLMPNPENPKKDSDRSDHGE